MSTLSIKNYYAAWGMKNATFCLSYNLTLINATIVVINTNPEWLIDKNGEWIAVNNMQNIDGEYCIKSWGSRDHVIDVYSNIRHLEDKDLNKPKTRLLKHKQTEWDWIEK